jgi:hypothetical protein
MAALEASTDPVVRVAFVDAIPWHRVAQHQAILQRLRSDPDPAIRLLANIAVFSTDDPAAWPALDAAIRAGLEPCAGVLNASGSRLSLTAGERWADVADRPQGVHSGVVPVYQCRPDREFQAVGGLVHGSQVAPPRSREATDVRSGLKPRARGS